eukprot:scpid77696/ scgid21991/ 
MHRTEFTHTRVLHRRHSSPSACYASLAIASLASPGQCIYAGKYYVTCLSSGGSSSSRKSNECACGCVRSRLWCSTLVLPLHVFADVRVELRYCWSSVAFGKESTLLTLSCLVFVSSSAREQFC